jgi:hypothetical protein
MQNWGLIFSSLLIRNNDCSSQVHEARGENEANVALVLQIETLGGEYVVQDQ